MLAGCGEPLRMKRWGWRRGAGPPVLAHRASAQAVAPPAQPLG